MSFLEGGGKYMQFASYMFNQTWLMIIFFILIIIHAFKLRSSKYKNANEDLISDCEMHMDFDKTIESITSKIIFAMALYCFLGGIFLLIAGWTNFANDLPTNEDHGIYHLTLHSIFSYFPFFSIGLGAYTLFKYKKEYLSE